MLRRLFSRLYEKLPLRFEATEAEALRAAAELHVPADIATETYPARAEKSSPSNRIR